MYVSTKENSRFLVFNTKKSKSKFSVYVVALTVVPRYRIRNRGPEKR